MKDIFGVILRATKDNTILATFGGFPGSTELYLRMLFLCAAKYFIFSVSNCVYLHLFTGRLIFNSFSFNMDSDHI